MSLVRDDVDAARVVATRGTAGEVFGDLSLFHRSLAELCRAELPLPTALRNLQDDGVGDLAADCAAMAAELEAGVPFEQAYASRSERFPEAYQAMVDAGVASGDLPAVLEEIAMDAAIRERVRQQLRRRLELPLFGALVVFVVGTLACLLLAPIAPAMVGVVLDHRSESSSTFGSLAFVWCAMIALLALVVGGVVVLRRPMDPGAGPNGWRYRLPVLGRLRSFAAKAGFASTMAMLLRRQLPLDKALDLCAAGCERGEVQAQVRRMAEQARLGGGLTESLRAGDLIPASLLWFVESAGSEAASVRALDDIAAIYRQRLQRATDRAAAFALPAIELVVGLAVLAFAMAYLLPAYEVFDILW